MKITMSILALAGIMMVAALSATQAQDFTTTTVTGRTGANIVPVAVNASSGNVFTNNGGTRLIIQNESATDGTTVTLVTQQTVLGLSVADDYVYVAPSTIRICGPFPVETFNYQTGTNTGRMLLQWTGATGDTTFRPFR